MKNEIVYSSKLRLINMFIICLTLRALGVVRTRITVDSSRVFLRWADSVRTS